MEEVARYLLRGVEETEGNLSHGRQCPGLDSNRSLPGYIASANVLGCLQGNKCVGPIWGTTNISTTQDELCAM